MENSTQNRRHRRKIARTTTFDSDQEVNSIEWKFITITEQEEDLIRRMFKLVGDRWDLIAGRVPGRTAEEIERFWMMTNHEMFADIRNKHSKLHLSKPQTETVFEIFQSLDKS